MSTKSAPARPAPRLYLATPVVDDPAMLIASLPDLLATADIAAVLLRLKETDQRGHGPPAGKPIEPVTLGGQ